MGQRAMCYHLFLCHLFYHSSYCRFPPLHVFDHRLSFCCKLPPHHCCKLPPTFFSDLRCHSGS